MCSNDSQKLLNCPFCGGEAETWSHYFEEEDMTLWQVRCKERPYDVEHPCYTADSFISFTTEAEAVEAWNTRAAVTDDKFAIAVHDGDVWRKERTCHVKDLGGLPGMIPLLACDFCGEPNYARADGSAWNYCPNCGSKVIVNERIKNG